MNYFTPACRLPLIFAILIVISACLTPKIALATGDESAVSLLADTAFSTAVRIVVQDARAQSADDDRIQAAKQEMERARRSRGFAYFGFRLLLSFGLVIVGITLAVRRLKTLAAPVAPVLDMLAAQRVLIGIAVIGLALFDAVLDIRISRPLIGDGLPQIMALLAGLMAMRPLIEELIDNVNLDGLADKLELKRDEIGFAAMGLGIIHVVVGYYPVI